MTTNQRAGLCVKNFNINMFKSCLCGEQTEGITSGSGEFVVVHCYLEDHSVLQSYVSPKIDSSHCLEHTFLIHNLDYLDVSIKRPLPLSRVSGLCNTLKCKPVSCKIVCL